MPELFATSRERVFFVVQEEPFLCRTHDDKQ